MALTKKSVGFFGGSFNPIHLGHLIAAERARETFNLEMVYFIPTWSSPHKTNISLAPPFHRIQMIKLAIGDNAYFSVLLADIHRQRPTYTIDTIEDIAIHFPRAQYTYYFIVGSDAIEKLPSWKSPRQILKSLHFLVAQRQKKPLETTFFDLIYKEIPEAKNRIHCFPMPYIEISSSVIRDRVSKKKSIQYLVPKTVESYIDNNTLYKEAFI
jgi:nicotinate-nucleotide adenylyltransferase